MDKQEPHSLQHFFNKCHFHFLLRATALAVLEIGFCPVVSFRHIRQFLSVCFISRRFMLHVHVILHQVLEVFLIQPIFARGLGQYLFLFCQNNMCFEIYAHILLIKCGVKWHL